MHDAVGIILMTAFLVPVLRRSLPRACSVQWIILTFAQTAVEKMRRSPHAIHLLVTFSLHCPQAVLDKCVFPAWESWV